MGEILNMGPDEYWTFDRKRNLARAFGRHGFKFVLIINKFHPDPQEQKELYKAWAEGREKPSLFQKIWRAL